MMARAAKVRLAAKVLPKPTVPVRRRKSRPGRYKAGPGRPKGSANRVTKDIRKNFQFLLEGELAEMHTALGRVRRKDPGRYLDTLLRLAEFCVPKLNRIEHTGEGAEAMAKMANALTAGILVAQDAAAAADIYRELISAPAPLPAIEHEPTKPEGDESGQDQSERTGEPEPR